MSKSIGCHSLGRGGCEQWRRRRRRRGWLNGCGHRRGRRCFGGRVHDGTSRQSDQRRRRNPSHHTPGKHELCDLMCVGRMPVRAAAGGAAKEV